MWRRCAGAVVAAAVAWAIAPAAARAGIWTAIPSGTASDTTAIEYQPDGRIWFTTAAGAIFTRRPDGTLAETRPASGVRLNDIAFQPGGQVGLAVGNGGQVLRTADGGASWSAVAITARTDAGAPATTCDGLPHPLGDVRAVHFAGSGTAWLAAQGTQLLRSRPATAAGVGAAGTWADANWLGVGSGCRLATTYNEGVADLFVVPSNPAVGWFCGSWFGEVRFTANDLGSVTERPGGCGCATPGRSGCCCAAGAGGGSPRGAPASGAADGGSPGCRCRPRHRSAATRSSSASCGTGARSGARSAGRSSSCEAGRAGARPASPPTPCR